MKYSININQAGIADAGFADGKTDLIDWAIIDYINTFATNPAAVTQNGRVWINYRHLLDQMPLLGLRTKSALSGRISKLQDLGLLSVDYDADKRLFAKLTARCHDAINFRSSNSTGVRPGEQGVRVDEQGCSPRRTFIRESVLENQDKKSVTPPTPPKGGDSKFTKDKFNPETIPLPDWLPRGSWLEWCQHRRDKGKAITQLAANKQLKQLAEYREHGHDPTAVIDHCIANGYQGLFPPRSTNHEASRRTRKETPLEAGVRELQEMRERIANGNIIEWLNQDGPLPFG